MEKRVVSLVLGTLGLLLGVAGVAVLLLPIHKWDCYSDRSCEKGERSTFYPKDLGTCPGGVGSGASCSKKGPAESNTTNVVLISVSGVFVAAGAAALWWAARAPK